MTDEPKIVNVRAIDAVPYKYAVWCSFEDGKPFANTIVLRAATDDGKIRFMLDTHNFLWAYPNDMLDLVEQDPGHTPEFAAKLAADDARRMSAINDIPLLDREWAL